MLEMGLVVALGLVFIYIKLSWRGRLWINSHPLFMDLTVSALLYILHWGTYSGVMVAAVGAMFCSMTIFVTRKWFGFASNGTYVPGWMNVGDKL